MNQYLRSISLIALCLTPWGVAAQNSSWVKLVTSANGEYSSYLDASLDAITQLGKASWVVWIKMEYSVNKRDSILGPSYRSEHRRYVVRCDEKTIATTVRNRFNESGSPVAQESWPESAWEFRPVGPRGGTNSIEFAGICSLVLFPKRVIDFSDRGNWLQAGGSPSDSIDSSSVQRMGDLYSARMRFVRPQDVRVGNAFYRTAYTYELGNCKDGTSGAYAYGFVNRQDQVVESGLIALENIKMAPVQPDSAIGAVHRVICGQNSASKPAPEPSSTVSADSSGTGFFVSPDGHILTNNHVPGTCRSIMVRTADRETVPARLVGTDQRNDLAVLQVEKRPATFATFRQSPAEVGEQVYAFGFPLAGVLSSGGNASAGIVSALAGLGDDTSKIQISAPVQPGNSGGPLYDRFGQVIAVIVEKLDTVAVVKATGDVPQNVNFAIKQSNATAMLDSLAIKYSTSTRSLPMESTAVFGQARDQAVFIICKK